MLKHVCSLVAPLDESLELDRITGMMPSASEYDGMYYHINRYPAGGLFQGEDPAVNDVTAGQSLVGRFPLLKNKSNALIIAGKVRGTPHD